MGAPMGARRNSELAALRARCARVWGLETERTVRAARRGSVVLCSLGTLLAVVGLVGALGAGVAASASVAPVVVEGNPTCADLGYDAGIKIDPPTAGQHTDGTITVTVVIDGSFVDWTSDIPVDAVIVKGGPVANVYTYVPPSTGDTDLVTATNPNNDQPYGLSHIDFCYDSETPTTTAASTTTTGEETTTTTGEETTTTTGASTTSSTVEDQGSTTTTGEEETTTTLAVGPTGVVGTQQTPTTAPGTLPRTGADLLPLLFAGLALLGLGARLASAAGRARVTAP